MKKYTDSLRLAYDMMRSVRRQSGEGNILDVPAGAFQFSYTNPKTKDVWKGTAKTADEKMKLANMIFIKNIDRPVNKKVEGGVEAIQAFTGSANLPSIDSGQAWTAFVDDRTYDVGYRKLFRMVEVKPGTRQFTIATGKKGAKMEKIPEGGKVKVAGFSGERLTVLCEKYGLAFGITWEMMEGNDFNAFKDEFMNYESELYGTWADVHYAVIRYCADASGNTAVTYQSGTDTLEKDINTINEAKVQLVKQLEDKYGNAASQTKLYLLADITLEARINRAMKSAGNPYDKAAISGNIEPLFTSNINIQREAASDTNKPLEPILVLPGKKLQDAVKFQNLELKEKDIMSLGEVVAGWTAFGVGAGEVLQCKRMYMHS